MYIALCLSNTRRAISDKTLDTMAKTYNNPRKITRTLLRIWQNTQEN